MCEHGAQHVICSADEDYAKKMTETCKELNAKVCLECIAGDTPSEMFGFMGFSSVCVLYGALSEKPVIMSPLKMIG